MNSCDISLYGIIDPHRTGGRALADLTRAAADGGVTLLQYRDKEGDTRSLIENATTIKQALSGYDAPLLINDRVDVALAVEAEGVHVGQSDMTPKDARRLLGPNAIIGLTIKTEQHAVQAPLDLIDYACIGGVYTTLSKDNPSNIGLQGWREIAAHFRQAAPDLPVGAIAGIDASNLEVVLQNGADGAAIISAIFMADDVTMATRELKQITNRCLS
ncbi:MAG: thiamine phosphate synthase [Rhizobiaceae bacterium]|nr:thiamine phosphate synthase [Rhizobiaceae bacterium]